MVLEPFWNDENGADDVQKHEEVKNCARNRKHGRFFWVSVTAFEVGCKSSKVNKFQHSGACNCKVRQSSRAVVENCCEGNAVGKAGERAYNTC